MSWILMQPAEYEKYTKADAHLESTGECLFDMDLNREIFKPVSYESRACTDMKRKFHSFVDESASLRWVIGQNHKYLGGVTSMGCVIAK